MRFRPTSALIDLDAIASNVRVLRPPSAELMAVVKADAYGHGATQVARASLGAGATWLGVALVEEGLALREAGIDAPILVLSEPPRGAEKDAVVAKLAAAVYTRDGVAALAEASGATGRPAAVHLKIDTGMHRVGAAPGDVTDLARQASEAGLLLEGVWTHFAKADEPSDPATEHQLRVFSDCLQALRASGIEPRYVHAANSAGTIAHPSARYDLVRVGIAMYGLAPSDEIGRGGLMPAMSLRSRVSFVKRVRAGESLSYGHRYSLRRESTIATVPVGYADGYPRAASGRAQALIRGKPYPVAGTVTMDQILVDLGDDPVEAGDEVVLFGRQGDAEITADELAAWAGTIGYEIVCGIGPRVPRDHRGGP
ncbi:MAG TPA: alanine racemase [Actinomycetota bacterium]|nr:alanine racemase [Actinomycetota bacterium]